MRPACSTSTTAHRRSRRCHVRGEHPGEMPMKTEPQQEHRWLEQLLGEWTVTSDMTPDGGSPWVERVRSLDGLWIVAEGEGEMPGGGAATTLMTLGYDPRRQRYVGTWVGSMMIHMWVYEGHLDDSGRSEEHTSELQSLMRISYAVFCLKKKRTQK